MLVATRTRRKTKRPTVPKKWRQLLCSLPKYDPFDLAGDCWFDIEAAREALDFFPTCLQHVKGPMAGQPFKLERWEQAIIANLFGWKRSDDLRRYRIAFIFVAKKNGKTPLAAGIILYMLTCDNEPGAEIYSSANDREQARLIFGYANLMVKASKALQRRLRVYRNSIIQIDPDTGLETGSSYKPISSESYGKHGYNTYVHINDELHAQRDRELIDVLEGSTLARAQPLTIYITTSDYDRESICNEKYDYAQKVRKGTIPDGAFLPAIYESHPQDDWKKVSTWRKANPNYGVSFTADSFRAEFRKAVETPSYRNTFKRLHLNLRTKTETLWLDMDKWDACATPVVEEALLGKRCFCGMDLSSTKDVTASVLLFPPDEDCEFWRILPRFYIPQENAKAREERDHVPYLAWAEEGYITMTPGNVVDYAYMKKDFKQDYKTFAIEEIAFDMWNFEALHQQFVEEGIDEKRFASIGQGHKSMSAPSKEFEKLILTGLLAHGGHPVLRWMANNTVIIEGDGATIRPSKKKSTGKIDGIVCAIMALGQAMTAPKPKESIYSQRGIIWI